jgi:hypothetical protein
MTSTAQTYPAPAYGTLRLPMAAFEVLAYLAIVAVATLLFLAGWLPVNGAVVLTVLLLTSLIVLSWINLGQGRHPCFLFLCTLMFFQGGRLLAYCLGAEREPLRVVLMSPNPFSLTRGEQGMVLLGLVLSAICVYAPCRWKYHAIAPPDPRTARRYLPYLYLLYFMSLPVQLFKNYRYYEYVQQHGGYTMIYINHAALAASVPFFVRTIPLITFPVFVAIFVLETRKKFLFVATVLYFATALFILLLGSRASIFALVLVLWYIARVKSQKGSRVVLLAVAVAMLILAAGLIQTMRENPGNTQADTIGPIEFIALQGVSLNVTEVAVGFQDRFRPYWWSYLTGEIKDAFVANDAANYHRGLAFGFDVSVFLNPVTFSWGYGTGGSYLAEAYVTAGLAGVVLVSLLIGNGLWYVHHLSGTVATLVVVAMVLPDVILMPRAGLLDWLSILLRSLGSLALLGIGWQAFSLLISVRGGVPGTRSTAPASTTGS